MQGEGSFLYLKLFYFTYAIAPTINSVPFSPSTPSMSPIVNMFLLSSDMYSQETFLECPFSEAQYTHFLSLWPLSSTTTV